MVKDATVVDQRDRIELVYRAQFERLWRALVGYTCDPDIAGDAMAEAFARALRDAESIKDVAAWTWRVAFRLAAAELRMRGSGRAELPRDEDFAPDQLADLVRALRTLSPNQRLAIVLHDYADRPTAEVAAVIGCSRATVHVHLSQGRRRLRDLLEVRDD
jgi:RNA polymerase sigma-70 factor, ECF subfamily